MSWIAVGIGAAVGVAGGAAIGSKKGGDDVWKGALIGGALGATAGAGAGALGGGAAAAGEGAALTGAGEGAALTGAGEAGSAIALEGGSGLALGGAGLETGGAMGLGGAGAVEGGGAAMGSGISALPTGAGGVGSGVATGSSAASGFAPAASGQMVAIPGVTPAAGVYPSSVPATLQMSVPGATVGGPGITSGAGAVSGAGGAGGGGGGGAGGIGGWWKGLSALEQAGVLGAGTAGLGYLLNQDSKKYGVPEEETYSGPLSKFKYDPSTYKPEYAKPNVYEAKYAEGGIAALAGGGDPMNPMNNPVYPQSQQEHTNFASSTQYPTSMRSAMESDYDARTNPALGTELPMGMAQGGVSGLGGYSDGGQLLKGPGDGVSDSIPASIGNKQPARLADGEFVVPARAVSELGNGSTEAGAKQLYAMLDRIQKKRKKGSGLAYQANPKKIMPA